MATLFGRLSLESTLNRLVVFVSLSMSLLVSSCGVLFCVDTTGKLYQMRVRIVTQDDRPVVGASLYSLPHGYRLFQGSGDFLGGLPDSSDNQGLIKFSEHTKNYASCESPPDFESLAPISIMVVHPQYDTAKVTLSAADLRKASIEGGEFVLVDIVMQVSVR